eukprot:9294776-Alexandrium_andersonii.AAC.1
MGKSPGAGASAPRFSAGSGSRKGAVAAGRAPCAAGRAGGLGTLGLERGHHLRGVIISGEPKSKSQMGSGLGSPRIAS